MRTDYTGKTFGMLKVLSYIETDVTVMPKDGRTLYQALWRCKCECGAYITRVGKFFRQKTSMFCCGDRNCKYELKKRGELITLKAKMKNRLLDKHEKLKRWQQW